MEEPQSPTPSPEKSEKICKYTKIIADYMEETACTIPQLIDFCAQTMAKLDKSRNKKNKTSE